MNAVPWCPSLAILAGESVEDRVIRFLRSFDGVSLLNRKDELAMLTGRGVDPGTVQAYLWQTNCAQGGVLGMLAAACCTLENAREFHPLLGQVSKNGASIAWVYEMGRELDVHVPVTPATLADCVRDQNERLFVLGYASGAHVEWGWDLDFNSNGSRVAPHGGAGRPNNAFSIGAPSDLGYSAGRAVTDVFFFTRHLREVAPSPDAATGELDRVAILGESAPAGDWK